MAKFWYVVWDMAQNFWFFEKKIFYFYLKQTKQKEKNFHHLKFEKYVCRYDSPFCNPLAQLLLRDITIVKKEMKCFAL